VRVKKQFRLSGDVAVPDVGTDRGDLGTDSGGDGREPRDNRGFQAIGEHRQQVQLALTRPRADDRHKVVMAF
jgi:hypothetical protein